MESTELQSACVSLGFRERNSYALEPDCLSTVKLLIRFLRNEPDGHSVRWQLGYARIVQNDLIPMVQYHFHNRELTDAVLRLLLNLSQPTLVCFNGRVPTDRPTRKIFIELDQFLCAYKQAFANVDFLKVITASMAKLVKSEHEGKLREEDRLVLERYLLLIRNVLHIDDFKFHASGLAGEDLSGPGVHDELLLAISRSGLDKLLLYLATSSDEHGFALHILEILWLLFKDITPSLLVAASKNDGSGAIKLTSDDLSELRKPLGVANNVARRASYRAELRGTYSVQNKWLEESKVPEQQKSSPSSLMVIHRHSGANDASSALDVISTSKKRAKKSSQRDIAMEDTMEKQRSDIIGTVRPAVRDFLANFARRLLMDASGYNNLMAAADRTITSSPADSHDESFYLWAIAFFMELARGLMPIPKAVECIGQTLGLEALTFVHTHMTTYADGLETDRFDKQMWNKRLVLGIRAFAEQIAWADALARCKDDAGVAELGRTLVFNIVYEPQFRDVLPQLLKRYKESRHSRAYLRSLAAAVHNQLKLMDYLRQSCGDTVVVAAPKRHKSSGAAKKAKLAKKGKQKKNADDAALPAVVKKPWEDVETVIRDTVTSFVEVTGSEFSDDPRVRSVIDPLLQDNNVEAALSRVGCLFVKEEPKYGVAAIRLARKLFPEHSDSLGGSEPSNDEDMLFIEKIYETANVTQEPEADSGNENEDGDIDNNIGNDGEEDDDNENDDEEGLTSKSSGGGRETQMNVTDLAVKFCSVTTLHPYVVLLETWATNSVETNHHIARFMKRVAIDWSLPAMLYQLRIFQTCQQILVAQDGGKTGGSSTSSELASFAKFAVNGFFKLWATVGKLSFVELLFWKNRQDALAFADNYQTLIDDAAAAQVEPKKKKSAKHADEVPPADTDEIVKIPLLKASPPTRKRYDSSSDDADDEAWANLVKSNDNDPSNVATNVTGKSNGKPKKSRKSSSKKSKEPENDKESSSEKAITTNSGDDGDDVVINKRAKARKRSQKPTGEHSPEVKKMKPETTTTTIVIPVSSTKQSRLNDFSKTVDDDDDDDAPLASIGDGKSAQMAPPSPASSSSSISLEIVDDVENFDENILLKARELSSDEDDDDNIKISQSKAKLNSDDNDDQELTTAASNNRQRKKVRRLVSSSSENDSD